MVSTAIMPEKSTKFLNFKIEKGRFTGILDGETYDIKEIIKYGNGDTIVIYYLNGEEQMFTQESKSGYVNERVYGEVVG